MPNRNNSEPNDKLIEIFKVALDNEEYSTVFYFFENDVASIHGKIAQDIDSYKGFFGWMYNNERAYFHEFFNGNHKEIDWLQDMIEEEKSESVDSEELGDEGDSEENEEGEEDQSPPPKKMVTFEDDDMDVRSIDSGVTSLGTMSVQSGRNKSFVARVSYETGSNTPTLDLIPSTWRLQTALGTDQGAHVTAYVLLLESLAHCRGVHVKQLPEKFFQLAVRLLPDKINDVFEPKKGDVLSEIVKKREIRKSVTQLLRTSGKTNAHLREVKNNLKKAEIEVIARHIETISDLLITFLNILENQVFIGRKNDVLALNVAVMKETIDNSGYLKSIKDAMKAGLDKIPQLTDYELRKIVQTPVIKKNLGIGKGLDYLKSITPGKRYNEGYVITHIKGNITALGGLKNVKDKEKILFEIGKNIAKLFDYPRVDKQDTFTENAVDRIDDEYVLYETLPRHLIISFAAFNELQQLSPKEKGLIIDAVLDHILRLQLWSLHIVKDNSNNDVRLDRPILLQGMAKFANFDASTEYSMKSEKDHPKKLYASHRPAAPAFGAAAASSSVRVVESEPVDAVERARTVAHRPVQVVTGGDGVSADNPNRMFTKASAASNPAPASRNQNNQSPPR